jgi:AcrR family transcriptional regulator
MMATLTNGNFSQASRYMLKVPVQKRSRETVSSIVESCARILITNPYHEITTDKIAAMAGVSIGSLYQFFANKEAIVSAVVDDLLAKDITILTQGLANIPQTDLDGKIRAMIDMGFTRFHTDRELRAALQSVQGLLDYWDSRQIFFDTYQKHILQHIPELPGRDRELVALLVVSTFNNALNIHLLQANQTPEREEQFKKEIFLLVTRYLRP